MAKFLTTRGTTSEIERIINEAKTRLVLISPYLSIPETLLECLEAASKKVRIELVYGKNELSADTVTQLHSISNLSVFFYKHVHAKCYFNEESMVITSLNLFDFSESHNREMGISVTKQADPDIYRDAVAEAGRIINFAERVYLKTQRIKNEVPSANRNTSGRVSTEPVHGHCIRCGTQVPLDPNKPYCRTCYESWAEWENPEYEENCCHMCGKPTATTIDYPLCKVCFRKLQF